MKLTCDRTKLQNAFQTVASVVPARSTKEILKSAKLEAAGGNAVFMGTDLEVGVRVIVDGVEVEREGAALFPVEQFSAILRESSDEKLKIETSDAATTVLGDRSEFHLPSANPHEYPTIPDFEESRYYQMPAAFLRESIRRTSFATDQESSRYALGGVLFAFSGKSLNFVATDGRRLARVDGQCEPVELNEGPEIQAIVAARHTTLMERTLFEQEGMVRVAPRQNDLMMHTPKATVFARLLEGRFPRWRDVFPQRSDASRIELAVGPFFAAVRQAAIATTKDSKGVDFAFTSGMVTLSSTAANAGDARVELPLAYDGPTIELSMNPGFLSDYLRVLDPQTTFTLEIKDAESPAVCLVPGGYSYVIMPMARGR